MRSITPSSRKRHLSHDLTSFKRSAEIIQVPYSVQVTESDLLRMMEVLERQLPVPESRLTCVLRPPLAVCIEMYFFFGRLNIEVAVISNHFLLPASMKTWVSLRADSLASVFPESA